MKFSQFHKELTEAKKLRNVLTDAEMEKSMKKALADKANWKGGKVNWNFIDADMYMELTAKGYDLRAASIDYMNRFDKLADKLDPEMNESQAVEVPMDEEKLDKKMKTAMERLIIKMKKDKKKTSEILKALEVNFPSYDTNLFYAEFKNELVEGRNGSPDGDRNTTAENPLIIIFDDEFKSGKPGMSGMMNLKTWMSIHGINKKFQKELAQSVLDAGEGKQIEVSKKVLKDTHDEYKDEGLRPRRYWIELSPHHKKEAK